jgi:hypothetical protein
VPFVNVDKHLIKKKFLFQIYINQNKPICSRLCFRSAFHFIFSARFNINAAVVLEGVKPHSFVIRCVRDGIGNCSINGLARDEAADDEREEFE